MKRNALTNLVAAIGSMAVLTSSAIAGEVVVDKNPPAPVVEKWWSADLSFGYDSLYVFRGVSVLGLSSSDGIIWTNLSGTYTPITNLSFTTGVWWANSFNECFGANYPGGTFYNELDAYASATYSAGPVDLTAGYIYYNYPYLTPGGLYDTHELTFGVAYTALPYVTPSMVWYYDMARYQGWYSEVRLDGEIPVYGDIVTLNPSLWMSFDFGSLRKQFAGDSVVNKAGNAPELGGAASINDIGVGLKAVVKVNEVISISPYVKASFPVGVGTAINANYAQHYKGDMNKLWAGTAVTFSF